VRGAAAGAAPGADGAEGADRADGSPAVRLDKWLWAIRLFKTRADAAQAIESGHVDVDERPAKPGRTLRRGQQVSIRHPGWVQTVVVKGLSSQRGPAPVARELYEETADSLRAREQTLQQRRMGLEPALSQVQGRPTKRDRRELGRWQRWSASIDD
jgi:ribosome-associated heat shock protein Hsp15